MRLDFLVRATQGRHRDRPGEHGRGNGQDDGFTLVETLAAMIVLSVLAASVGGVLLSTLGLTQSNTARVAAANLATKEIETVRALRAVDVPDGATVVSPKPVVNGVEYTVTRTATYVSSDSATSPCTGPSSSSGVKLGYKLITVEVTWPRMGSVRPVRQDTLLALGVGFASVSGDKGTGAVAVLGANDQPRSGVTVTLVPGGTQITTGTDGCAVFAGLTPGTSYSAVVDQDGWVDRSGAKRSTTATFGVTASGVTRVTLPYDRVGAVAVTLVAPESLPFPTDLSVTISSSATGLDYALLDCTAVSTSPYNCVSGAPRTAARVFPGQYGVWAGSCQNSRPPTSALATVVAGSTASVSASLAGARVTVVNSSGSPVAGKDVYALRSADGTCLARTYPLSPSGGSTQTIALPAGTWTFALDTLGTASTAPITLTAGAVTAVTVVAA